MTFLRPLFAQGDPQPIGAVPHHAPSTPVRTGGPTSPRGGTPHLAFDPCSHREAGENASLPAAASLRPLFAQGDRERQPEEYRRSPSTPVRTGRPFGSVFHFLRSSFDPCSHRETALTAAGFAHFRLRPLFAQGDLSVEALRPPGLPSTPVRTGRPPSNAATFRSRAFDPCSHRETEPVFRVVKCHNLRPLFAQGDQAVWCDETTRRPSTPVRTGRPLFPNLLNYIRFTNCTPSKSTTTRRRFAPTFLIRTPPGMPFL